MLKKMILSSFIVAATIMSADEYQEMPIVSDTQNNDSTEMVRLDTTDKTTTNNEESSAIITPSINCEKNVEAKVQVETVSYYNYDGISSFPVTVRSQNIEGEY